MITFEEYASKFKVGDIVELVSMCDAIKKIEEYVDDGFDLDEVCDNALFDYNENEHTDYVGDVFEIIHINRNSDPIFFDAEIKSIKDESIICVYLYAIKHQNEYEVELL